MQYTVPSDIATDLRRPTILTINIPADLAITRT